jgi:hypothetical protein
MSSFAACWKRTPMTHLFDLAVFSVALALLCAAIMTATAELLGRKPRWRFFFVAFGWFWFWLATAGVVLILMLR